MTIGKSLKLTFVFGMLLCWFNEFPMYLFCCGWLVYLRSIIGVCISAIMDTRSHSSQVPGDRGGAQQQQQGWLG